MSLEQYKSKRKFENTPEPKGVKIKKEEQLRFVIQKHHASHLHYDFRLEMEGVLKSWAVPKGPSTDPSIKRLAMMVEDHPYDYKDFEGVIPKGNYGAGKVIVWDEGTYEPIEDIQDKKKQEETLLGQLKAGSLKFRLDGHKLKGEYALVRTKGMGENAWLLIKHKDKFASKADITEKDKSILSGLTVDDIDTAAKKRPAKAKSKQQQDSKKKPTDKATAVENQIEKSPGLKKAKKATVKTVTATRKGKKQGMPGSLSPMLATLIREPFDDPDWEYEIKWDGYRAIAFVDSSNVQIKSRNDKSFNDKYYPVYQALKDMNLQAVLDGEIVAVNEKGISDFGVLQNWRSEADGQLLYYVFDLLWYNGKNMMNLPLSERKALLEKLISDSGNALVRTGFSISGKGTALFETAKKIGIEGIIAKLSTSTYTPGSRSRDWLKIKIQNRQEVVIVGYTKNEGSPKPFSALLLAVYENGSLRYAGKVGTGFNQEQQKEMLRAFKPLERKTSPLNQEPDINLPSRFRPVPPNAKATWLKPELVAEINYTEVTNDGFFRHPSFVGMRVDKDPKSVALEKKTDNEAILDEKSHAASIIRPPRKSKRRTLLNPREETQVKKINGQQLKFTNLSKLYWPEEKITKRDLLNYYYQVAAYILPYLKDRPQSLNRFPNGIHGKSFYQKDITGKAPGWVKTLPYQSKDDDQEKNYLLGNDEATLLYMANLGAIEMNPWSSTMQTPDNPDWCILDLDPGSKSTFEHVIETAQVIKQILDELNIQGYPKTSGSTGMHIYIPLNAKYTYDQSQLLAQWIAAKAQSHLSDITSLERMVKKRNGKLYIDFLQNRPTATLAAPYSARPKPGATVSMPLHWNEVKSGLKISDFNIFNAPDRIQKEGDIFKAVLGKGIDLNKLIHQLEA